MPPNNVRKLLDEIESDVLRSLRDVSNLSSKEDKQDYFARQRKLAIERNRIYIRENIELLKKNSVEGNTIDIGNIKPYIELVDDLEGTRTFKLYRFLSTYPFTEPAGRRIKFFIRDGGHKKSPIMGIACLSSPVMNLGVRDKYIGWTPGDPIKYARLKNTVELSCAVAIPPYNLLCVGKLIALLALSSDLVAHYGLKYRDPNSYVLVLASGLYGKNCTLFKRLTLEGHKLYSYIGDTKGFTHIHIDPLLYDKIEKVADLSAIRLLRGSGFLTSRRLKNIETVFYHMKTPYRKLLMLPLTKAIFAAPVAFNFRGYLLGTDKKANHRMCTAASLISLWKDRWMNMRKENAMVAESIKRFSIESHYKSLGLLQNEPGQAAYQADVG